MFNNLGPEFKTYLTVVNDRMQKDKKLEKDKVLFKAIEEKETWIKAKRKACANFISTNSNAKSSRDSAKKKKSLLNDLNVRSVAGNI